MIRGDWTGWRRAAWLAIVGVSAVAGAAGSNVSVPQRVAALWAAGGEQHLDLFATDTSGAAISTWWERGCGWQPWFAIQPASGRFQPGQTIAPVWNGEHLDLFAVDRNGRVVSTWWEFAKTWQPWFAIHPETVAAPGQTVTPLWSGATHLDLFITDRDGRVASTWWEPVKSWQPWFLIHPETARAIPGQEVTAVWANGNRHLDLFMSDADGRIVSTWWEASSGWQRWFAIHPESALAAPGQPVTAVWAAGGRHLDLFITDRTGHARSTWWEANRGWQPWFAIHPETAFAPKQRVTALWSNAGHLDLFAAAASGEVRSTWWEAAPSWQPWFAIQPSSLTAKSPQSVTALWNGGRRHLDLFATGIDGSVASTWWESAPSWQPWFRIFPDGAVQRLDDRRNVVTQAADNHRTGAFPAERILTPQSVSSGRFGRLYSRHVEGQIFGQPLYLRDVATRGRGRRNLLLVATTANRVYAFDADDAGGNETAALVAQRQLHPSAALTPGAGNTSVGVCDQTFPYFFGITATPVVDPLTATMFVVAYDTSAPHLGRYVLHALDLRAPDLADRVPPVEVSAPGFSAHRGRNRPGLLLMNGVVYVAFGSFICDHPLDFTGWVLGYRHEDLSRAGIYRTDPTLNGAGIWQSGRGLVGDGESVYFMTGNENAQNPRPDSIANSFVKLGATCSTLTQAARFTPANSVELSLGDTDLGSSGPLLLPGNRLIGGGKQGRVYVLDPGTMTLTQNQTSPDGFQGFEAFVNTWRNNPQAPLCAPNADAICRKRLPGTYPFLQGGNELAGIDCRVPQTDPQKIERCAVVNGWIAKPGCFLPHACYQFDQGMGPNLHAGFVYWRGFPDPDKGRLYALPEKEFLKAFAYDESTGGVAESPVKTHDQIRTPDGMPGAALSLSSNGSRDGIVWVSTHDEDAMMKVHPGHLYAVDADTFRVLWQEAGIEFFAKFNPPIVADGKVVLPTWGRPANNDPLRQTQAAIVVYGLRQ